MKIYIIFTQILMFSPPLHSFYGTVLEGCVRAGVFVGVFPKWLTDFVYGVYVDRRIDPEYKLLQHVMYLPCSVSVQIGEVNKNN